MLKTPRTGEHHGNTVFIAGIDHFLVPNGAAGLNHQ
jgi:hypothetical protein